MEDLREHLFSLSVTEKETGPPLLISQSFLNETKAHLDAIEAQYNQLLPLRVEINDLLAGFKQVLHLEENTQLSVCFKHLREMVGQYKTLKLNQEMKIIIDEEEEDDDDDGDAREAVKKFNLMLEKCRELPEKLNTAKTDVEERIRALENERVQIQETLDAIDRAKKQLDDLATWAQQIEQIERSTKSAASCLAPTVVATGMIERLEEN